VTSAAQAKMSLKLSAIFGNVGVGGRKAPSAAEALRMEYDMMNMQNVDDVAILTRLGVSRDGACTACHARKRESRTRRFRFPCISRWPVLVFPWTVTPCVHVCCLLAKR